MTVRVDGVSLDRQETCNLAGRELCRVLGQGAVSTGAQMPTYPHITRQVCKPLGVLLVLHPAVSRTVGLEGWRLSLPPRAHTSSAGA